MTSIVCVHGAWGGSYGFAKIRRPLWSGGHDVHTPSLTGIGERSHLSAPTITLSTHISDVVNTILYEDLHDIVLLGFSYGGMVVTGALDHIGHRVNHLVYLDAFVPTDGQSVDTIRGHAAPRTIALNQAWFAPPIPRELPDPAETAWSNERRAMQPIGTFTEPVRLSKPIDAWDFTRTYIKATADPGEADDSGFWQAGRAAEASPAWEYHEIATGHLVASTHPDELAAILQDLAER